MTNIPNIINVERMPLFYNIHFEDGIRMTVVGRRSRKPKPNFYHFSLYHGEYYTGIDIL